MSDNSNVHISNDLFNVRSQARNSLRHVILLPSCLAGTKAPGKTNLKEAFIVARLPKVLLGRHGRTHGLGGRTLKFVHIWTVQGAKSLGWT